MRISDIRPTLLLFLVAVSIFPAILIGCGSHPQYSSESETIDAAYRLYLDGHVDTALSFFETVENSTTDSAVRRRAAIGKAYALYSQGAYEEASGMISAFDTAAKSDSDALALMKSLSERKDTALPDAIIHPAPHPVRIDGSLDEWDLVRSELPSPIWSAPAHRSGWVTASEVSSQKMPPLVGAYMSYDTDHIFLAFDVDDAQVRNGSREAFWKGSHITILIDARNGKFEHPREGVYNFWLGPGSPPYMGFNNMVPGLLPLETDPDLKSMPFAVAPRPGGYKVELAIPGKLISHWDPIRFRKMGFNYSIGSVQPTPKGNEFHRTLWRYTMTRDYISLTTVFWQPDHWGTVVFHL